MPYEGLPSWSEVFEDENRGAVNAAVKAILRETVKDTNAQEFGVRNRSPRGYSSEVLMVPRLIFRKKQIDSPALTRNLNLGQHELMLEISPNSNRVITGREVMPYFLRSTLSIADHFRPDLQADLPNELPQLVKGLIQNVINYPIGDLAEDWQIWREGRPFRQMIDEEGLI